MGTTESKSTLKSTLERVCCIIDAAGFNTRVSNFCDSYEKFLIRELAYIRIDPLQEFSPVEYRFDLRTELSRLSQTERRRVEQHSRNVLGIDALPEKEEVVQRYSSLETVVQNIYRTYPEEDYWSSSSD